MPNKKFHYIQRFHSQKKKFYFNRKKPQYGGENKEPPQPSFSLSRSCPQGVKTPSPRAQSMRLLSRPEIESMWRR